ncbi:hypothetical protein PG994_013672 [Apiospora phragmitis]|uniref:FAD-binding domain-containing protein n=1 Tax=Apiospora phragmitis TaxID=2905665 RepID=A0ABR1TBM4_9PEZI
MRFTGHTWPEQLVATDVLMKNYEVPKYPTAYVMHPTYYTVMTPLAEPKLGETSLWRFTIAQQPGDTRSAEELAHPDHLRSLPRPLEYEIIQASLYRIHQRLATTLRRGRCLLAGDAAHVNNPYGGLSLNTGILDASALADALEMILNEGRSEELLNIYSQERSKVFQKFVDPTNTYNKLRLHATDPETAAEEDWYFKALNSKDPAVAQEMAAPYFDTWPTDMRKLAAKRGL